MASAEVDVYDSSGNFVAAAETASDGTYSVSGLDTGTYKVGFVFFEGNYYAAQFYNGKCSLATADPVSVTAGSTTSNINAALVRAKPGVPQLASGSSTPNTGAFTIEWAPSCETASVSGITYTLQHKNASGVWEAVASGLSSPEYTFSWGGPEAEGTWGYRVMASGDGTESEYSGASTEVKVDRGAPNAPSATASRAPDYAGGGGWYKNTVTVSFASNGDPPLADGSPGSGVSPASISAPQTFNISGSHTACGTVSDNAGNHSKPGCLTVQVDATPPSVQISCPASVLIGSTGVKATVTASDGQSGLASDPSGAVVIETNTAGSKTVTRAAVDNVGHETTSSCTTRVGYSQVITGTAYGKLVVKAGQAVELAAKAIIIGPVTVEPGGAFDVEGGSTFPGALIFGPLKANKATLLRICGAWIAGPVEAINTSGPVVIGEGTAGCSMDLITGPVIVKSSAGGVTIKNSVVAGPLTVTGNAAGTTVVNNFVFGPLTVTGNSGTVVDKPNWVSGPSKLQ